jgi:hypothetical protein
LKILTTNFFNLRENLPRHLAPWCDIGGGCSVDDFIYVNRNNGIAPSVGVYLRFEFIDFNVSCHRHSPFGASGSGIQWVTVILPDVQKRPHAMSYRAIVIPPDLRYTITGDPSSGNLSSTLIQPLAFAKWSQGFFSH